jgi:Arc/MetJ-type ribon-helix-helix transcriptional regulator
MISQASMPEVVEGTPSQVDWNEALEQAVRATRDALKASAVAAGQALRQGGKLVGQAAGDVQRTIVVTVDEQMLKAVDNLVLAGVHKNRADAIRYLLRQGLKASGDLVAKIEKVEQEISELRQKMREIPLEGEDE